MWEKTNSSFNAPSRTNREASATVRMRVIVLSKRHTPANGFQSLGLFKLANKVTALSANSLCCSVSVPGNMPTATQSISDKLRSSNRTHTAKSMKILWSVVILSQQYTGGQKESLGSVQQHATTTRHVMAG